MVLAQPRPQLGRGLHLHALARCVGHVRFPYRPADPIGRPGVGGVAFGTDPTTERGIGGRARRARSRSACPPRPGSRAANAACPRERGSAEAAARLAWRVPGNVTRTSPVPPVRCRHPWVSREKRADVERSNATGLDRHELDALAGPIGAVDGVDRIAPMRRVNPRSGPYTDVFKPLLDRVTAAAALVVAAVPMALIAAVVAATMGRPVLFRQRRVGLHGVPFEVLKFRTMGHDRRTRSLDVIRDHRLTHKSIADPRHTPGRTVPPPLHSLDELPQLVNVPARRDERRRTSARARVGRRRLPTGPRATPPGPARPHRPVADLRPGRGADARERRLGPRLRRASLVHDRSRDPAEDPRRHARGTGPVTERTVGLGGQRRRESANMPSGDQHERDGEHVERAGQPDAVGHRVADDGERNCPPKTATVNSPDARPRASSGTDAMSQEVKFGNVDPSPAPTRQRAEHRGGERAGRRDDGEAEREPSRSSPP